MAVSLKRPSENAEHSYPQQSARTRRFSLGVPRNFGVTADGSHVAFLRSKGPTDPINCLWLLEVASGDEQLLFDPREPMPGSAGGEVADSKEAGDLIPAAERARRERARESAGGIVAYSTDQSGRIFTFALAGALLVVDTTARKVKASRIAIGPSAPAPTSTEQAESAAGVFDPRLSPDGRYVSFVVGDSLWVAPTDGSAPGRPLLTPATSHSTAAQTVSWGSAEFIAAEEMRRSRGHWWSPSSNALAVARVDVAPVLQWHIADPSNPATPAQTLRYPAAGTANAQVQLFVQAVPAEQAPLAVRWDAEAFPYLCDVIWPDEFGLTLVVQSRDQREMRTLSADLATGETQTIATQTDPAWVDIVVGAPAHSPFGLLTVGEHAGTRAIALNGQPITDPSEWVRAIVDVNWRQDKPGELDVLYLASQMPADVVLYALTVGADGTPKQRRALSRPQDVVASAVVNADICVISEASLQGATTFTVRRVPDTKVPGAKRATRKPSPERAISSHGADPFVALGFNATEPCQVEMHRVGPLQVPTAIVWPSPRSASAESAQGRTDRLPILLDPYGGPGAQRVLNARSAYAEAQWFADQGYCVVIADGRGTPGWAGTSGTGTLGTGTLGTGTLGAGTAGTGTNWQRAVRGDLAQAALADQLAALNFVIANFADRVNPDAVAIRGWSFGGYLAALAVLRAPERFHAAIAGAPVTDWTLYDTHYTERYLGNPNQEPENYRRSSLLDDRPQIQRPIMLIHGLADDNVVAAHTLRLSSALLAAGHQHEVLPLSGVTHMTPQEVVAENLVLAQADFLRRKLSVAS